MCSRQALEEKKKKQEAESLKLLAAAEANAPRKAEKPTTEKASGSLEPGKMEAKNETQEFAADSKGPLVGEAGKMGARSEEGASFLHES